MIETNNVNAVNASYGDGTGGGVDGGGGGGGLIAAICAAFCKDNQLGQQFGLDQTNAVSNGAPVTSQSKCVCDVTATT